MSRLNEEVKEVWMKCGNEVQTEDEKKCENERKRLSE